VFVKEDNSEFTLLNQLPNIPNMDIPIINEEDILNRLKKLILINLQDLMEYISESFMKLEMK